MGWLLQKKCYYFEAKGASDFDFMPIAIMLYEKKNQIPAIAACKSL